MALERHTRLRNVRHVLIEKKAACKWSSSSGGGAEDGGRETLDSGWLRVARRMQWAREARWHEREPSWWLGDGRGAAGQAVTDEFMGNIGDGKISPPEKNGKRGGVGALIAEGDREELEAASPERCPAAC
jgi:hypothetical protein